MRRVIYGLDDIIMQTVLKSNPRAWKPSTLRVPCRRFSCLNNASSNHSPSLSLSLERSIGENAGKDAELRTSGYFSTEVIPDLPAATTWQTWLQVLSGQRTPSPTINPTLITTGSAKKVTSVSANLRSMSEIEQRIRLMCCAAPNQPCPPEAQQADALLFVSGSHPIRSIPLVNSLLPGTVDMLKIAVKLRTAGEIASSTSLYAVANPNVEKDAAYMEQKVEQGAEAIVTQPPFKMSRFMSFYADAERRGLLSTCKLIVGIPVISSPGNLAFWNDLCFCTDGEAKSAVEKLQKAATLGKEAAQEACFQYNIDMLKQVTNLPGVAGLHIMPITPFSKKMTLKLCKEGYMSRSST